MIMDPDPANSAINIVSLAKHSQVVSHVQEIGLTLLIVIAQTEPMMEDSRFVPLAI